MFTGPNNQQIRDNHGISLHPRSQIFALYPYIVILIISEYIFIFWSIENGIQNKKKITKPVKASGSRKEYPKQRSLLFYDLGTGHYYMAVDVTINIRLFVANFSGKGREMILIFQILNLFSFAKIIFPLFQCHRVVVFICILVKSLCSVGQKCYCKVVWLYRWYSKVPNEALSSQTSLICQWETMNRISFTGWNVGQVFGSLCLEHITHSTLSFYTLYCEHGTQKGKMFK